MSEKLKYQTLMTLTALMMGEECVTLDLEPMLYRMLEDSRYEEAMYLTQFNLEEAKHTYFMRAWLDAVGEKQDLDKGNYIMYNEKGEPTLVHWILSYEEPRVMRRLYTDGSPSALARASTLYGQLIEGVGAEFIFKFYFKTLGMRGYLPGFVEGMKQVNRDEARHVAFHTYVISREIAQQGEPLWKEVKGYMVELLNYLIQGAKEIFLPFQRMYGDFEGMTFNELLNVITNEFSRRVNRMEKALNKSPEEITFGLRHVQEAMIEAGVEGDEIRLEGGVAGD